MTRKEMKPSLTSMISESKTPPQCAFRKHRELVFHQELGIVASLGGSDFDDDAVHDATVPSAR
jgi:hypothetical protein